MFVFIEMVVFASKSFDIVANAIICIAINGIYKIVQMFKKRRAIVALLEEYYNDKSMKIGDKKEEAIIKKFSAEIRFD